MKERGERITMLTSYDATFSRLLDRAGIDVLLVGDSLGMVVQGHDSTIPVTLEEMIYHCRAVIRGRGDGRSHVVCDLPFMTYQANVDNALMNAGRLLKEGGAEAVKLEGGQTVVETVHRMVSAGIPVMGHLGLTPQSVHQLGGWKVQGKSPEAADQIVNDAISLAQAGAYAIVLETVPSDVALRVTQAVDVPTIGIGAGPDCDGQVLVIYDLLGLSPDFNPKFLKKYANLGMDVMRACKAFSAEVKDGAFPAVENCY
jgi:3-methyl-2-oxobutanoate hydroxymethyltransferase